jgi:hypothetical protein
VSSKVNACWNNVEKPQTGPSMGKWSTKGPEAFIPKGEALINPDYKSERASHRNALHQSQQIYCQT